MIGVSRLDGYERGGSCAIVFISGTVGFNQWVQIGTVCFPAQVCSLLPPPMLHAPCSMLAPGHPGSLNWLHRAPATASAAFQAQLHSFPPPLSRAFQATSGKTSHQSPRRRSTERVEKKTFTTKKFGPPIPLLSSSLPPSQTSQLLVSSRISQSSHHLLPPQVF